MADKKLAYEKLLNDYEQNYAANNQELLENITSLYDSYKAIEQNSIAAAQIHKLENLITQISESAEKCFTSKSLLKSFEVSDLIFNSATATPAKTAVVGLMGAYLTLSISSLIAIKKSESLSKEEKFNLYRAPIESSYSITNFINLLIKDRTKAAKQCYDIFELNVKAFNKISKNGDLNDILKLIKSNLEDAKINTAKKYSRALFESSVDAFDKYTVKPTAFVKKFESIIQDSSGDFYKVFSNMASEIEPEKLKQSNS